MNISSLFTAMITEANKVIDEGFDRYGDDVSLCFNGGKDSTVLLDLVLKEAKKRGINVRPFYLEAPDEFPEIIDFINESEKYWGIHVIHIKAENLKVGLEYLINDYKVKAVFLGVRSTDFPNNEDKIDFFAETTEGWPHSMRIMPILNWNYAHVWNYIDTQKIPICSLYEHGYTSIGAMSKTKPNPYLLNKETGEYLHARMLKDDNLERIWRIK